MHLRSTFVLTTALTLLAVLAAAPEAQAQDAPLPKNSFYVELGGNAVLYSINFDRVVSDPFSLRAGIGFYRLNSSDSDGDITASAIPLTANYLLGRGTSRLELGIGVLLLAGGIDVGDLDESNSTAGPTATFAYRYQKPDGGVFFKGGFTPFLIEGNFFPWFGVSLGYTL